MTVITSNYHLRRGSILFKGEAMVKAESLGITLIQVLENAVYHTHKSIEYSIISSSLLYTFSSNDFIWVNISFTFDFCFQISG